MNPPKYPVAKGQLHLWPEVEEMMGMNLPESYKEFINVYGSGDVFGCISIVSPFRLDNSFDRQSNELLRWSEGSALEYSSMKKSFGERFPEKFPFGINSNHDRILSFAGMESGGYIFWIINEGHCENAIILYSEDFFEYEIFAKDIVGLIIDIKRGDISSSVLEIDQKNLSLGFHSLRGSGPIG